MIIYLFTNVLCYLSSSLTFKKAFPYEPTRRAAIIQRLNEIGVNGPIQRHDKWHPLIAEGRVLELRGRLVLAACLEQFTYSFVAYSN